MMNWLAARNNVFLNYPYPALELFITITNGVFLLRVEWLPRAGWGIFCYFDGRHF